MQEFQSTHLDAHEFSNYKEWKAKQRLNVEIDLSLLGVSNEKIQQLYKGILFCMIKKVAFMLYTEDRESSVIFMPEFLKAKQNGTIISYRSETDMLNGIKLATLAHREIYIHLEIEKINHADIRTKTRPQPLLPKW